MPTINASPNPVGVYSAATPATTLISWFTEAAYSGIVYVIENGVDKGPMAGQQPGGDRRGTDLPFNEVRLGSAYRFSLRRANDVNVEIAFVDVTTFDLRTQLATGFGSSSVAQLGGPQIVPQIITNLVVKPGIDTVRIAFRTTRPTIPTTELRDENGNYVDGRMPLFGGLRTRHEAVFGIETPLALNKKHSFRIEAFGSTNDPASPNKAVVTGEFMTGRRNVEVFFESLDLHDDSDSGGVGELSFAFGVGDVGTGAILGPSQFFSRDMSDKDPPLTLTNTFSLTDAHRLLWLRVFAAEDDHDFPGGIGAVGMRLGNWDGPGGRYRDDGDLETADLTIVANVETDPGEWTIPFELRTGDWPLDFVVTGRLEVEALEGAVISTKMAKLAPPSSSSAYLGEPGSVARLAVGGVGERSEQVARGADGAFYHRSLRGEFPTNPDFGGWARLELPGRGTPTVVAIGDGFALIDLDQRGGVLHCRYDPRKPKGARWSKLGGNFAVVVPAVDYGKGRGSESGLILFGIADDGDLFVRDAGQDGRDWDRLGDRPVRAVAPVSATGLKAALFAVDDDGNLIHFAKQGGRWRSQTLGRIPGDVPVQSLTAAVIDRIEGKDAKSLRRDVVIGAMSTDRQVRTLRWPDYPSGPADRRWQEAGSLQDLLMANEAEPSKPRRKSSKA